MKPKLGKIIEMIGTPKGVANEWFSTKLWRLGVFNGRRVPNEPTVYI
jgi:hypothetical protein